MDFAIYSLYSNLVDTKVKFCSLCFKIVKEKAASVQDSVILSLDEDEAVCSTSEEVDVMFILQEVLGDKTASYLSESDTICDKCTRSAISSYKFIKMCQKNTESLATAVDLFMDTVSDPKANNKNQKTLFLSMNFQELSCIHHFDTMKFVNNKSALTRFQSLYRAYKVLSDDEGNTMYQCTQCPVTYPKAMSTRRHFTTKHIQIDPDRKDTQNVITVSVRDSPTKVRRKRTKREVKTENSCTDTEVKKKTVAKQTNCIVCNENFENKYALTKHILKEHSIETVKDFAGIKTDNDVFDYVYTVVKDENDCEKCRCKVCGKLFTNHANVTSHFKNQHLKICESYEQFICSHCGKECSDENALKRHEEHHTFKLTCPKCNKEYKSKVFFKQHVCFKGKTRSDLKRDAQCSECGKKFASENSLRIHVRYQHGPHAQRYKCQHCPKTYGAFSHWKAHQIKHTKERNFKCDLCGNFFVTRMALVYHTRIHTGERPFECKYCDMKFLSSSRRAAHTNRHHIVKFSTCDICGVTVKATGLAKHKRRHDNVNSTLYTNPDGQSIKKRHLKNVVKVVGVRQQRSSYGSDDSD